MRPRKAEVCSRGVFFVLDKYGTEVYNLKMQISCKFAYGS